MRLAIVRLAVTRRIVLLALALSACGHSGDLAARLGECTEFCAPWSVVAYERTTTTARCECAADADGGR